MPLAFQSPYPIIVYSVANYRTHLSHFGEKCNFHNPWRFIKVLNRRATEFDTQAKNW